MSELDTATERKYGRSTRSAVQQIVRKTPQRRFRAMPPEPLAFDLDALPASTRLTQHETAAALRRGIGTLENWRKDPDHPLKWRRVGGRVLYELASLRGFLKGDA